VVEIKVDDDHSDERSHSSNSDGSIRRSSHGDPNGTPITSREEVYSVSPSAGTSADSATKNPHTVQQPQSSSSGNAVHSAEQPKLSTMTGHSSSLGGGSGSNLNSFPFGSPYGSHLFPLPHR
jgi:hypothetical protein